MRNFVRANAGRVLRILYVLVFAGNFLWVPWGVPPGGTTALTHYRFVELRDGWLWAGPDETGQGIEYIKAAYLAVPDGPRIALRSLALLTLGFIPFAFRFRARSGRPQAVQTANTAAGISNRKERTSA